MRSSRKGFMCNVGISPVDGTSRVQDRKMLIDCRKSYMPPGSKALQKTVDGIRFASA